MHFLKRHAAKDFGHNDVQISKQKKYYSYLRTILYAINFYRAPLHILCPHVGLIFEGIISIFFYGVIVISQKGTLHLSY